MIEGTHYLNCGDWVESCTAIIETLDGQLRVIQRATQDAAAA
jgi:UDP-2,3-diacylglucosamine pyrophosphatase LpxH